MRTIRRHRALESALVGAAVLAASTLWAQTAPASDGEVTKIDNAQNRVTLRHRGIKNLDMPAMTMTFRVADGRHLQDLAVGDRVRFTADKVGGNYTVTTLVKTR
jgi:Cu/Ag efflux protein CusF